MFAMVLQLVQTELLKMPWLVAVLRVVDAAAEAALEFLQEMEKMAPYDAR